ncbi:kinesin-like protein [Achlya hypogyna]|uniref:Kinesin-like protein n=1 Tax=Achlya hypogyna TaxID=1202772 RepID=A0A1V9YZE0_ACHHY|nr:kinesin-like protein [Achlya hypogyna]
MNREATCATRVVVRVRPMSDKEKGSGQSPVVSIKGSSVQLRAGRPDNPLAELMPPRVFQFDQCFGEQDEETVQAAIFQEIGVDLLENAFNGFNCSVFAYGQTGSGKTYTMVGDKSDRGKGLIPRICEALFEQIELRRTKEAENNGVCADAAQPKTIYNVQVNYCEIYKEKVKDLLDETKHGQRPMSPTASSEESRPLKIREHPVHGPFVEGLTTRSVGSYAEIEEELLAGQKLRTVAATLMNPTSSRSHAIFTILFTQTRIDPVTLCGHDKTSKICLVDLAGSERSDTSGTSGERLKEASMINRSLSTLGRVISSLSSNERIPYRDSTLTWLLKESLGGNAKTTMLAMVSPASDNYEETLSTLRYAESAKKIINRVVVNEDKNAAIIRQLRQEIAELRAQLERLPRRRSSESSAGLFASLAEREGMLLQLQKSLHETQTVVLRSQHPSLINLQEDLVENEPLACTLFPGLTLLGSDPPKNADEWKAEAPSFVGHGDPDDPKDWPVAPLKLVADAAHLLPLHAKLLNDNGFLTLAPFPTAEVFVNDELVGSFAPLKHRDRVRFGALHHFRVHVPLEATFRRSAKASPKDNQTDAAGPDEGLEAEEEDTAKPQEQEVDESLTLQLQIARANQLCEAHALPYRLDSDSPDIIRVNWSNGDPTDVSWDAATFEIRAALLEKLAAGGEETDAAAIFDMPLPPATATDLSATNVVAGAPAKAMADPFAEQPSSSVRLMGHARLFIGYGISKGLTASHTKMLKGMSRLVSVYNSVGAHVASITVDLVYELNKAKATRGLLSPRRAASSLNLQVTLKEITFVSGIVCSDGIYATYRVWNQTGTSASPKAQRCGSGVFSLGHTFSTQVACPENHSLDDVLAAANISIDVWGWGDMVPITLTTRTMYIAQLHQTVLDHASRLDISPDSSAVKPRRRQNLPIAAKLDVFVSVDVEERNADGIYESVSVKDDGTLRLRQGQPRRLVVRAVQADHQHFCLVGLSQVRLCEERSRFKQPRTEYAAAAALGSATLAGFFNKYSSEETAIESPPARNAAKWTTLGFRNPSQIDPEARTVSCVLKWDAAPLEELCRRGERRVIRVAIALDTQLSEVPVIVSKTVTTKICPAATSLKQLQRQVESAWWARESSSRLHRLGKWFAIEIVKPEASRSFDDEAASSKALLAEKLLDHYGKGVHKLDVAFDLERFRQRYLAETESLAMSDATEETEVNHRVECATKSTPEHEVREIEQELFVESRVSPGILVHLKSGTLVDTTDAPADVSGVAHVVTQD